MPQTGKNSNNLSVLEANVFSLASRLNRREDLLSCFMVSLLAWKTLRRPLLQGIGMRRLGRASYGLALLLVWFLTAQPAAAEPKLDVSLDPATISLGDSTVLSMSFEDCSPPGTPNLPQMANIEIGGQSSQQSFSLVNGSMTRKTTYSVELHPTRDGNFTIPSLVFTVDGGVRLRSRPITLRVMKGNVPQPSGAPEIAFVKIVPSANVIYLGQILPVEVQCYCQDNVGNIQLPQFTSDNFIIGDLPNPRQRPGRVQVGNTVYNLFSFHTSATAIKTGVLPLGPATWSLAVLSGQRDFFGRATESHQASFTSDAPEIRVLPVPTNGAPPGFTGALGDFTLSQYDAGPTSVGVGDPVTLKIRIAGHGAFDTVTLPTNNEAEWREFKMYPPTAKLDTSDPMQIEGSKYFEQVISPQNAQIKEIPAFVFSFFDPTRNAFRTLTHPAIPLNVHATAATPQPTVISTGPAQDGQEQGGEIVHIKPMLGEVRSSSLPLIEKTGFLALQGLPPLAWACALFWRRQKEKLANNPRLRRQRRLAELVREGLAALARSAAANDADKFYATVLDLLQEQLGERLDLPAPAITEAVLDDLPQNSLRPETLALLRELFHACNQYRYTPDHTSREMAGLIPKVKAALQDLRAMPAAPAKTNFAQGAALLILLLSVMTLRAEPAPQAFNQANRLYEEGKYTQAAAAYENILQTGAVSPALYFNLGNAWLKAGQIGRAVRAYRQAEALAPRDPDIRANLQIARNQASANHPALPGTRWTRWVGRLTLNEWTVSASLVAALFFFGLTAREISPALKKSGAGLIVVLGLAFLVLASCLGLAVNQRLLEKSSVVIVPEAVARRGPLPESQSAFTLHDGAELLVLGTDGDWLQVSDGAKHIGWLAQKDAALIP
jgi:tetratricopeptide (TPR) repeat protein